ncbi:phosphotransferase family protein [Lentzea albidocapillata]|uniref:phosphotransferase family protein n=1 Tax=Lentzea albidocapillata TaxID=40571 RepID=UPI000A8D113A|nr:hypothetical protein [Lentzea albidocapillata]
MNRVGQLTGAKDIVQGAASDLSTVLFTAEGPDVFLKGVRGVSVRMRWLRNEITAGAIAAGIAPAVRFHADIDDWLLVGFEHLKGRTASLAPHSPDLGTVAEVLGTLSAITTSELRPLRDRWTLTDAWITLAGTNPEVVAGWDVAKLTHHATLITELIDGSCLLHTDMHGEQFLIDESGAAHVIDWAFPARGAAWVDGAFLTLRLIEAGHSPQEAERWVLQLPGFAEVDAEPRLTAFSAFIAGLWTTWAVSSNPPAGAAHRARLALDYAAYRFRTNENGGSLEW